MHITINISKKKNWENELLKLTGVKNFKLISCEIMIFMEFCALENIITVQEIIMSYSITESELAKLR